MLTRVLFVLPLLTVTLWLMWYQPETQQVRGLIPWITGVITLSLLIWIGVAKIKGYKWSDFEIAMIAPPLGVFGFIFFGSLVFS